MVGVLLVRLSLPQCMRRTWREHAIIFKPKPAGTTSTVRLQKQHFECKSQTVMSSPPSTWSVVAGASVPSQLHAVTSAGCTCKHLILQKSSKTVLFRPTAAFWMAGAPGKLPPMHCGQHLVEGESTSNLLRGQQLAVVQGCMSPVPAGVM